jgi:hypothetical protein
MNTKKDTTQELNEVLSTIDDAILRDQLFESFYVLDPLQYAKLLYSLSLEDDVYAKLLGLKVEAPPQYHGADISPLIDRAMEIMWERLADAAAIVDATI